MQGLNNLKYKAGTKHSIKRVGRGPASGHGKTSGRGNKGQNSRTGGGTRPGFEGGQNPLYRRLPKEKGFKNLLFKVSYIAVNLEDIIKIEKSEIKIQDMIDGGLVNKNERIKVLGSGDVNKAVTIEAHAFSKSAKEKIEKAGGKAVTCATI